MDSKEIPQYRKVRPRRGHHQRQDDISESIYSNEQPIYGLQHDIKEERNQIFAEAMKEAYERPNDFDMEPSLLSSTNPYSRTSLEELAAAIPEPTE